MAAKKEAKGTPKKPAAISPQTRRAWLNLRRAWVTSFQAFSYALSQLDTRQSEAMYDMVKKALFKDSYAQIVQQHPELREFVRSDEDRICMIEIYEVLSWRLNRSEKPPPDRLAYRGMKGRIGRNVPEFSS